MKTIGMGLITAILLTGCATGLPHARMTKAQVLSVAEPAMAARFAESVPKHRPYHADLSNGVWHVWGTLPQDVRGGTPEAKVRDSDGKVLEVYHTQ